MTMLKFLYKRASQDWFIAYAASYNENAVLLTFALILKGCAAFYDSDFVQGINRLIFANVWVAIQIAILCGSRYNNLVVI
jgi:hypothetical protein